MYYSPDPKYFVEEEFFPEQVVLTEGAGNSIWRLMDSRILWTISELRKYYKKSITINNYKWGGQNHLRGYRPITELIDFEEFSRTGKLIPSFSSFTTQHAFGRALDFDVNGMSSEEVREDILNNYLMSKRYQYITAIEGGVSWVHIDIRAWDVTLGGIMVF